MTVDDRPTATPGPPGARYWHRSLHEYAELMAQGPGGREGGPGEPARFARFGGLPRHPLPRPARLLGGIGRAFGPPAAPGPGRPAPPSAEFHSTLLHYTAGVLRTEFGPTARWPYHRAAPSARCFAPVETYLWTPGCEGLPAGIHAYDPAHHSLVLLREGDFRPVLGAALDVDLGDAVGVLLLSTVPWRTAFRYGGYAYRLCAQETGLVAGNALMVAGALGVGAQLHHQFLDGVLERLIGVSPPEESVAAVLPLRPVRPGRPPAVRWLGRAATEGGLRSATAGLPGRPAAPTGLHALPELTELAAAGRLVDTASFATLPATEQPTGRRTAVAEADLADCLRRRTSGSPAFRPQPRTLPGAAVRRALAPVLTPWAGDAVPAGSAAPVTAHLWAINVDGLAAGLHRVTADGPERLGPAPGAQDLGLAAPNIDYRAAGAVVFLSAPRAAAQAVFGDRGFRVLHQEAGVVAQRLCVTSAAEGLAARIHNGYRAGPLGRALGLPAGHEPLFQIVLAVPGADERYLMPVPVQPDLIRRQPDPVARNEESAP